MSAPRASRKVTVSAIVPQRAVAPVMAVSTIGLNLAEDYHSFIDYSPESAPGIIVPQRVFPVPPGQDPIGPWRLCPISFYSDGKRGLHLQTALNDSIATLDGPYDRCRLSEGMSRLTLRIQVSTVFYAGMYRSETK